MNSSAPGSERGSRPLIILVAHDNPGDHTILQRAITACRPSADLHQVQDGVELMDYLYRRGRFERQQAPFPDVILIATTMPRKSGLDALAEIQADPSLSTVPIVVLNPATAQDILESYELGASSFITKPMSYEEVNTTIRTFCDYWENTLQG